MVRLLLWDDRAFRQYVSNSNIHNRHVWGSSSVHEMMVAGVSRYAFHDGMSLDRVQLHVRPDSACRNRYTVVGTDTLPSYHGQHVC